MPFKKFNNVLELTKQSIKKASVVKNTEAFLKLYYKVNIEIKKIIIKKNYNISLLMLLL